MVQLHMGGYEGGLHPLSRKKKFLLRSENENEMFKTIPVKTVFIADF